MTKKIYYLLIISLLSITITTAKAEYVSQREAKKIAELFFNAAHGTKMPTPEFVYNGRRLTTDRLFSPFYIYNNTSGGFVIISADNKAFPILAYNLHSKFKQEEMTDDLKALLTLYARHIEYIRFDGQEPVKAIAAWQNLPQHIYNILNSTDAHNFGIKQNTKELINRFTTDVETDYTTSSSAIYYPEQWQDLMKEEICLNELYAFGIVNDEILTPILMKGYKGDMFRLLINNSISGYYRLFPTEIISQDHIAIFSNRTANEEEPWEEETPSFEFYDSYIAEMNAERQAQQTAIQTAHLVVEPIVCYNGGGHYSITLPENISMARVFNLSGAEATRTTYSNTNSALIDISHQPNGFYFAVIYGETGKRYNIKLFR